MVKPTQVELPPIHITAQAPDSNFNISSNPPPVPEAIRFGGYITTEIIQWNQAFELSLALVISAVDEEVSVARSGQPLGTESQTGILSELSVINGLVEKKTAEISALSPVADKFYGVDPVGLTTDEQVKQIAAHMRAGEDLRLLRADITASHEAAYKRRFMVQGLARLNEQTAALRAKLVEVQARDAAQQAELDAQRLQDEQRRLEAAANTFQAPATAASQAVVFAAAGTLSLAEGATTTLQAAIRTAITALAQIAAGTVSGFFVGVTALVYSPKLSNGEMPQRFAVTLPLADLGPAPAVDLAAVAADGGTVNVQIRLESTFVDEHRSQIIVVPTDGISVPNTVRVVAATFNAERNVYSATTADTPPRTLIWTPVVPPIDSSTSLPVETPPAPVYDGATVTPMEVRIDGYPEVADSGFDDYIFVFPADSGLPALYLVFKDSRSIPGVSSGEGGPIAGIFLDPLSLDPTPIPAQIAALLTRREFSSFSKLREAIWKAVASDPMLGPKFGAFDLARMQEGKAPVADMTQHSGKRKVYELHHKVHISMGGEVYALDNLQIMTPQQHILTHKTGE